MTSEGFGGKNSRDVRKGREYMLPGWEDVDEKGADDAYENFTEELEEHGVVLGTDMKVLEIGSGNGSMLQRLKLAGIDAIGVDARPGGDPSISQVAARAERLPFPDQTFTAVSSNFAFDSNAYNQDQNLMLKEISRVLKEGGLLVNWGGSISTNDPRLVLVSNPEKHWATTYQKRTHE